MLHAIKRLFSKPGQLDLAEMSDWARRLGHGFKRVRGNEGFVIEGLLEGRPWRGEWGAPQRDYIQGHELRLRMELDLPSDAQMLLLSRPLMDRLERKTFEEFTDNVQTQIGTKTPEEMRWLVMFPKVGLGGVKVLRGRFGAVASQPAVALAWIDGALANMLDSVADTLLQDDPPFVLMTLRGRAYLRLQLDVPDPRRVATALGLFETAVTQALAAAGGPVERRGDTGGGRSTAWQSFPPDPPTRG